MTASDDPEHYRMRASEMRERAERADLPAAKAGLQRIAEDFDLLATRAESRMATIAKLAGSQAPSAGASAESPAGEPKSDAKSDTKSDAPAA